MTVKEAKDIRKSQKYDSSVKLELPIENQFIILITQTFPRQ